MIDLGMETTTMLSTEWVTKMRPIENKVGTHGIIGFLIVKEISARHSFGTPFNHHTRSFIIIRRGHTDGVMALILAILGHFYQRGGVVLQQRSQIHKPKVPRIVNETGKVLGTDPRR